MTLTRALREELARREAAGDPPAARDAETAAALRFGGAWVRRGPGGGAGWVFETPVAAAARRIRAAVAARSASAPMLEAQRAGGLAREARWRVVVEDPAVLAALGLTDEAGRPLAMAVPAAEPDRVGAVRGALLAAGTLSAPGRDPHLEVRAPSEAAATALLAAVRGLGVEAATGRHGDGWRVVAKSGEAIGRLLVRVEAHATFLAFDEGRLRRQLRGEANRAANAERGNLGRTVAASSRQAAAIARLLADVTPGELPEDLRVVALARLANPGASLAELAGLLGLGRATVHRRLARLERLADRPTADGSADPDEYGVPDRQ